METIYLTARAAAPQEAPVIDLNEYRQRLERQRAQQTKAAEPESGEAAAPGRESLWEFVRQCRRPQTLGELLDVAASAAMVLTALVAAVAVLL